MSVAAMSRIWTQSESAGPHTCTATKVSSWGVCPLLRQHHSISDYTSATANTTRRHPPNDYNSTLRLFSRSMCSNGE
eukprot:454221-Amphidinium_carterae.1